MIVRIGLLALAGIVLAGCQTTGPGSVKGECKIFERPEYAVLGKRRYDQDWIDSQIEGGVGGCGWKRPKARPASFDARSGQKVATKPVQRRTIVQRIKDRVAPQPVPAPVSEPLRPAPAPAVQVPTTLREPVDELLSPSDLVVRKVY